MEQAPHQVLVGIHGLLHPGPPLGTVVLYQGRHYAPILPKMRGVESVSEFSLRVAVFVIDPDPNAETDRELEVSSVEIEDGTVWVYVKDDKKEEA